MVAPAKRRSARERIQHLGTEAFREVLERGAYITRGFEQNLLVMTAREFEATSQRITALNLADPSVRLLQRLVLGNAARLEMDGNGRVIVPDGLADFAGLQNEVIFIGQGDHIEAWSPSAWEKQAGLLLDFESNSTRFAQLDLTLT